MLGFWRSAYLIVGYSILFVPSNQIGSDKFVPQVAQYTDNLVPDDSAQDYPVIQLNLGYIRGSWLTSTHGRRYAAYKGVPYAAPPLGNLRFEPPQERKTWAGVRNALSHGPQCPQVLFVLNKFVGFEDCLYLNIYVPQPNRGNLPRNSRDELLPIIFFIHGGSWAVGAGDMDNYLYGPDRLMDEDVIVVTINYRLGAMGFLYLGHAVPGNMGLKDQAMALKLIKANAKSFGGDPNRITIMGESAGAASAQFHLMNPESKKMIFGAIGQSGSVLSPWAWTRPEVLAERTRRLARLVRCPSNAESPYLLDCLKRVHPRELVRYQLFTDWSLLQIPIGVSFSPTTEPPGTPNAFIRDCPRNMLVRLRETPQTIPYILGYNTLEGQLFSKIAVTLLDSVVQAGARIKFGIPRQPAITGDYLRSLSYVQKESPSIVDNIIGDYEFKTPVIDSSRYHSNAGSNVYLYHFTFNGRSNFFKLFWDSKAPTHMDELTYLFEGRGWYGELPRIENATPEAAVSERLIRMWTNFAKTGNPTPVNKTGVDTYWPEGPSKILIIGKELTIGNSPVRTGWSGLIDKQCFL